MTDDNGDWLRKYHAERASYGGASHEFHARAQTWVATRDAEIARLKAEVSDARRHAVGVMATGFNRALDEAGAPPVSQDEQGSVFSGHDDLGGCRRADGPPLNPA